MSWLYCRFAYSIALFLSEVVDRLARRRDFISVSRLNSLLGILLHGRRRHLRDTARMQPASG